MAAAMAPTTLGSSAAPCEDGIPPHWGSSAQLGTQVSPVPASAVPDREDDTSAGTYGLELVLLVTCLMIWQYTSSRRTSCSAHSWGQARLA